MLRSDTSPVQDRIKRLKDMAFPGKIQFSACDNTKLGMEKTEGHAIPMLPEATIVACIGPRTAYDARAAGLAVNVIAETRSATSLVESLVEYAMSRTESTDV